MLAAAGDAQAMDQLIRLHEPSLLAFVRASAGPALRASESVRDILQDILIEFVQGLATIEYRGEAQFRGWLYTLAKRRVQDRARHYRREKRHVGREQSLGDEAASEALLREAYSAVGPLYELHQREDLQRLEAAFAKLSVGDREILSLAFFCGMSSLQIAAQLGLTQDTVRKRRTRARTRLAALWQEKEP